MSGRRDPPATYIFLVPTVNQLASSSCHKATDSCHNKWRKAQLYLPSVELLYTVLAWHSNIESSLCLIVCCFLSVTRALETRPFQDAPASSTYDADAKATPDSTWIYRAGCKQRRVFKFSKRRVVLSLLLKILYI